MNTLILHIPLDQAWSPIDLLLSLGGVVNDAGSVVLTDQKSWVSVLRCDEVVNDYDESDRDFLGKIIADRRSFLIEWNEDDFLAKVLSRIPGFVGIVVDNDHGVIVPYDLVRDSSIESWIRQKSLSEISV